MKKTQITALILSVLIAGGTISACSDENPASGNENNSAPSDTSLEVSDEQESETTPNLLEQMGTKDYEDADFNVLTFEESGYMHNYVDKTELTGEIINDAIFNRNRTIEDLYKVKINMIVDGDAPGKLKVSVTAGDKAYDIAYIRTYSTTDLMTGGYLTNLYSIDTLKLDGEWWLQNSVKTLSVGGKLYYANSYADMTFSDLCWTMFFNKSYIENYSLENPYELVSSGKWTFDTFYEMISSVTHDVDGDGFLKSSNDVYGVMTHTGSVSGMLIGSGFQLVEKDEDDLPYLTSYSSENEKLIEVMTRIGRIYNSDNFGPLSFSDGTGWGDVFYNGNAMFYMECLGYYPLIRERDIEIGLLPFPKYDESQEEYYNYLISPTVVCVPFDVDDSSRTGFILEALARYSYQKGSLYDAYFEITLGSKMINDVESKNILKTIIDSCTYDLSEIYNVNTILSNLGSNNEKLTSDKYESLASTMAKMEKSQTKLIQKLIENVSKLP